MLNGHGRRPASRPAASPQPGDAAEAAAFLLSEAPILAGR